MQYLISDLCVTELVAIPRVRFYGVRIKHPAIRLLKRLRVFFAPNLSAGVFFRLMAL